jgi:hypothetical protein
MRLKTLGCLLVLTGCGALPARGGATGNTGHDLLYVSSAARSQLDVIDSSLRTTMRTLPAQVISHDGSRAYWVDSTPGTSTVHVADISTARETAHVQLTGSGFSISSEYGQQSLSPDGRWLVLQNPAGAPEGLSHFAVVASDLAAPARTFDLRGSFVLDAIANDGKSVYFTEYLGSGYGGDYRVRAYDLATHTLDPSVVVAKGESPQMYGTRVTSLPSADGDWLFSLYLGRQHPFIHALNMSSRGAVCIDLPGQGYETFGDGWSLTATNDQTLTAFNGLSGQMIAVSTQDFRVTRTHTFKLAAGRPLEWAMGTLVVDAQAKGGAGAQAVLSHDGHALFAPAQHGVVVIDPATFTLRRTYIADQRVRSVAVSRDGAALYAITGDGSLVRVDLESGAATTIQGPSDLWAIVRVSPA